MEPSINHVQVQDSGNGQRKEGYMRGGHGHGREYEDEHGGLTQSVV